MCKAYQKWPHGKIYRNTAVSFSKLFKDAVLRDRQIPLNPPGYDRLCELRMTDKRQASRQKSFLRGFAYFGHSSSAVDCLVRDISDTGARLKFSTPPAFTENLELHIPVKGSRFRSKVQWRSGDEIGVVFEIAAVPSPNISSKDADLANRVAQLEAEITLLKSFLKRLEDKAAQSGFAA